MVSSKNTKTTARHKTASYKQTTKAVFASVLASALLVACGGDNNSSANNTKNDSSKTEVTKEAVAKNWNNIAAAMYADSLTTAKALDKAVDAFIAAPSEATLNAAKAAYKAARVPYQQSEILRFDETKGNVSAGLDKDGGPASVDAWEGQVNAWPLDEALIDYVDTSKYEGEYKAAANIINTAGKITVGKASVDFTNITKDKLAKANELGGIEANVTTGVHAVEFLLWGQDTNGTNAGAGSRPVSDYYTTDAMGKCTSGTAENPDHNICKRRAQYLSEVTDLLVDDLTDMAAEWGEAAAKKPGTLAHDFVTKGDPVKQIIDSIGDMSSGELASERMRIAVLFKSTEDEHDCFSDLSHVAIQNNAQGIANAYRGSYKRIDGSMVKGASLKDLVMAKDANLAQKIDDTYTAALKKMQAISDKAEGGMAFDQQIADNTAKAVILDAAGTIDDSAKLIVQSATAIGVKAGEVDQGTCDTNDKSSCKE